MRTQSEDTHPDAERVQIELLRHAGTARRFELTRSMSNMVLRLAWRALRRANPESSEDELAITFVALHYGADLAELVRSRIDGRRP